MIQTNPNPEPSIPPIALVVNDDPATIEAYERILSNSEWWVTSSRADEALECALDLRPEVIVADVDHPAGLDFRDFCRRLQSDSKLRETPLVVIASQPELVTAPGVSMVLESRSYPSCSSLGFRNCSTRLASCETRGTQSGRSARACCPLSPPSMEVDVRPRHPVLREEHQMIRTEDWSCLTRTPLNIPCAVEKRASAPSTISPAEFRRLADAVDECRRQLDVQFRRIAQMQAELDLIRHASARTTPRRRHRS